MNPSAFAYEHVFEGKYELWKYWCPCSLSCVKVQDI